VNIKGIPVFVWPINWTDPVNGSWQFNLRELLLGFGPELTDIQQDHIIHGWEFGVDLRDDEIDNIDAFLDSLQGRARPFWMPGPAAAFKISGGNSVHTFLTSEQGSATSWQLQPGGYLWFTKIGEESQPAKIVSIVDNGDGTETVTVEEILDTQESSSSSNNSSSSTVASFTSSSSSGHSSSSSKNSSSSSKSSQSSQNSSSSNSTSSSSSEGNSSSSSIFPESTSSSSDFVAVDDTWQVFPLFLVRLAEDAESVELRAERWQRRNFKVVELPHDYSLIETTGTPTEPTAPVFLYRFSIDLPDGTVYWRFTSNPTDVILDPTGNQSSSSSSSSNDVATSSSSSSKSSASSNSSSGGSSQSSSSSSSSSVTFSSSSSSSSNSSSNSSSSTVASETSSSSSSSGDDSTTRWLAVPIEHSGLSRSAKLGGTVTVSADYDSVEPLRLCSPMRLSGTLRVEILRTDQDLDEPRSIFSGVVQSPSLTGRKIQVTCNEWGEAMDQKIPNFYIQRVCNYRVYDAGTCRVDRSAFQVAVSLVAAAGRIVIVQGASLAGKPKDWFAQGWIELGSGLDRRVLFVLTSSEPFDDEMELTISSVFDLELPLTGTLVPGCDGRRSTCIDKFNNLANFGGHATPKENLTLVAIKTNPTTGGKK
jgi:uncharacterized phage protein (TIGR02218 family)